MIKKAIFIAIFIVSLTAFSSLEFDKINTNNTQFLYLKKANKIKDINKLNNKKSTKLAYKKSPQQKQTKKYYHKTNYTNNNYNNYFNNINNYNRKNLYKLQLLNKLNSFNNFNNTQRANINLALLSLFRQTKPQIHYVPIFIPMYIPYSR